MGQAWDYSSAKVNECKKENGGPNSINYSQSVGELERTI